MPYLKASGVVYDGEAVSHIEGTDLSDEETGVDCFCIKSESMPSDGVPIPLGQYLLSWKRLIFVMFLIGFFIFIICIEKKIEF